MCQCILQHNDIASAVRLHLTIRKKRGDKTEWMTAVKTHRQNDSSNTDCVYKRLMCCNQARIGEKHGECFVVDPINTMRKSKHTVYL